MRLSTIGLLVTFGIGLLWTSLVATAQQPVKIPLLGILTRDSPPSEAERQRSPFQAQLRELGWHEGHTIAIEGRYAEGHVERLPALAAELVRLHVDVIVANGTPATQAAKQATSTIPIIMTGLGGNPVDTGLVASLARPEGNVTGVAGFDTELWGKRLELFKEAVPRLSHLAILWNPANPANVVAGRPIQAMARAMGVHLQSLEVRDANAFEHAFAEMAKEPPDAIYIGYDALTLAHARPIADFAVRHRLPTMTASRTYVQAGALMSYGPNIFDQWRRAAYYVDKILKGTKPADLPVERPMKFELVINLKTAKALGITMPPTLLMLADEVIR
jgi:putative ABC transport system substrate-binding protein